MHLKNLKHFEKYFDNSKCFTLKELIGKDCKIVFLDRTAHLFEFHHFYPIPVKLGIVKLEPDPTQAPTRN
jgi:hypothetical protein